MFKNISILKEEDSQRQHNIELKDTMNSKLKQLKSVQNNQTFVFEMTLFL